MIQFMQIIKHEQEYKMQQNTLIRINALNNECYYKYIHTYPDTLAMKVTMRNYPPPEGNSHIVRGGLGHWLAQESN